MDGKKLLLRIGTAMLTAILAIGLVAPAFATEAHTATVEGTIEKIVKGMDIPPMVKEHHPDVVKILKVYGIGILVTRETEIQFKDEEQMKLMVGDTVKITGEVAAIFAENIVVDNVEGRFRTDFNGDRSRIDGRIEKITYPPGVKAVLLVNGIHVIVKDTTIVDGKLKVGAGIEAAGKLHALLAQDIEVLD